MTLQDDEIERKAKEIIREFREKRKMFIDICRTAEALALAIESIVVVRERKLRKIGYVFKYDFDEDMG